MITIYKLGMVRIIEKRLWTWEAKVGSRSATKCSLGHIARSISWMGDVPVLGGLG